MKNEYEWILKNSDTINKISEKWVIILDDQIISVGNNLKQMMDEFKKEHPKETPFVLRVPEEGYVIV